MAHDAQKLDWRVMAPVFIVVAIDSMGMGVVLPLLPFYSQHFGASPLAIGVLISVFSFCQFVGGPWLGRQSDRFGRKPILLLSQLGTCLSFVLLACANSLALVFLARICAGLTAGNMSVATAYAADRSNAANRNRAMGVVGAAVGIGIMAGPALSGIVARTSISAPIWVAAGLSFLSILATTFLLPREGKAAGAKAGRGQQRPAPLKLTLGRPEVAGVLACMALFYVAFGMWSSQLPLFLGARFTWGSAPFGPQQVGWAYTAIGAVNVFTQLFALKWVERILSEAQLTVVSLGLISTGYLLLGLAHGVPFMALSLAVTMVGVSLARPILTATLTHTALPGQQGALMGANQSTMSICNIVAPLLAGLLIDRGWYLGWAFSVSAIAALALVLTLTLMANRRWPRPAHAEPPAQPALGEA